MTIVHKVVAEKGDGMEFVLSDATVDRYGDIVEPDGWVLANFKKNPIALFGHRSDSPIGTWANVHVEGGKLIGRLVLAAKGTSQRIDELIGLVEQNVLRAVSVGFRPIDSDPIDPKQPWGAQRYKKQELLECSLVSVPANPAALQLAKSLSISDETIALAFGEHADTRRRDVTATGKHADTTTEERRKTGPSSLPKVNSMKTVSQRLEEVQLKLARAQQRHADLINADELDAETIEAATAEVSKLEKDVEALKRAEATLAKGAGAAAPAINRRPLGFPQKDVKPFDLLVRKAVVSAVSMFTDKPVEKVLDDRYPGDAATAAIVSKDTAAAAATTGGSHFVDDLQQISYQGFVDALDGMSVLPALRAGGLALSLDSAGTAYVPGVAAGGAGGSFFAEGAPIRVGQVATNNVQLTSRKVGVIMVFSREAAKRSTPDLEALFRRRMLADTAAAVDSVLLDATAQDSVRPGGLLYDQVASAAITATASGYGGGDHIAVMNDFKALLAPFIAADAATGITVIMNPAQGLALDFMTGPDGALGDWFARARARFNFVESTHATANRLIAVRTQDFASAIGGVEFEMSSSATLHMEQTQADVEQIVTSGTAAGASPVRSLFQTDTKGVRMIWDLNWRMMRQGMVRWIDGTSW
jgi:HK97 family phage prohead protease